MTWEQKLQAITALDREASLKLRKPGDWYLSCRAEVKDRGCLIGKSGSGSTPELAVEDWWDQCVTNLPDEQYLVVHAYMPGRSAYRWQGFMWERVYEESPA